MRKSNKGIAQKENTPKELTLQATEKTTEKGNKKWIRKLWWEIPLGVVIGFVLIFGSWVAYRAVVATKKIVTENISGSAPAFLGKIGPRELKGEGDGRINILLLGIGGEGHQGEYLSDTIIVASIDPKTNKVAMLSIPRDLYVYIPDHGYNRINAAYSIGETTDYQGGGLALSKKVIGEILDLPIHYAARIDFDGFKNAVNIVGGVDVEVENDIYDPQYPTKSGGYQVFSIKKGKHHMDGELALKYARSRKSTSDFDRAKRQQQIITAIKDKALEAGTILNPSKVAELIDNLGNHFRTDLQIWEIQRLIDISKNLSSDDITSKVLDNSDENGLLVNKIINGAYVLVPKSGDYTEIRKFAHELFVDSYIKEENATIEVQNGTKYSGLAASLADILKSYSYNITNTKNAEKRDYTKTVIYDYTNGKKPYTVQFLSKRLNADIVPSKEESNFDIVIILGNDYKKNGGF